MKMDCPRCSLAELSETTQTCVVCGYSPAGDAGVDAATAAATELDARRELARQFRIEALLGQGPGGIVYLARDPLGRPVVVKVLPQRALGDAEARFRRAAEAAAALDHPHIIPLYRFGATPGFFWYSTKHVEGVSLEDMLRSAGPLEFTTCLRFLEQITSALDYAHRRGVAHGGLTAASVIIEANEWALVRDFAVAGLTSERGTPAAASGHEATPGTDQHALAALAYECLSGARPTPGQMPPMLGELRPDVRAYTSEALRRALSPRPMDRFPSVLDFVAALSHPTVPPGAGPWLGRAPRRAPGAPVVIIDPDEQRGGWGRRVALLLGGMGVLAAGVAWLNMSAAPAASPGRLSFARPAAPALSASPATVNEPRAELPRADSLEPTSASPPPASPPPGSPPPTRAPPQPPAARPLAQRQPAATTSPDRRPALLSINAIPWGGVYVDGDYIGNTPQVDVAVGPGMHELRVEREGFQAYERIVEVAAGEKLRITDIQLRELLP
jgi:serine/threonine-protein kinase